MEVAKKEIRNRRILFVIGIFVIGTAYYVSGQTVEIHKYTNRKDIVSVYPSEPMIASPSDDRSIGNTTLNIYVDKVNCDTTETSLTVYFGKGIYANDFNYLIISFIDGSSFKVFRSKINEKENYCEYLLDKGVLDNMYWMRTEMIVFKSGLNESISHKVLLNKGQQFFFHFLHVCNR